MEQRTLTGTARNSSLGNMVFRSSSEEQEPRTRLPPGENGEIAELWAPITMQANNSSGLIPVAAVRVGTSGYKAGHTTPRVLEKKLITALTILMATGTAQAGRLVPTHEAKRSMVPASIAT